MNTGNLYASTRAGKTPDIRGIPVLIVVAVEPLCQLFRQSTPLCCYCAQGVPNGANREPSRRETSSAVAPAQGRDDKLMEPSPILFPHPGPAPCVAVYTA